MLNCVLVFVFYLQELSSYLKVSTATSVIVDQSSDGEFLRIDFNIRYGVIDRHPVPHKESSILCSFCYQFFRYSKKYC